MIHDDPARFALCLALVIHLEPAVIQFANELDLLFGHCLFRLSKMVSHDMAWYRTIQEDPA